MRLESPSISRSCAAEAVRSGDIRSAAFRLDGPTRRLDPRTHAYRRDIADIALAGTLFAPHYAAPVLRAATASTMVRTAASHAAEASSQILPGEGFAVLDLAGDWAWGFSRHDHYVGYVAADVLGMPIQPTHRIAVREALLFSEPSIKSPAAGTLPYGTRLTGEARDHFIETDGGFVHKRHVAPIDELAIDAVAVAELFLGMPYLWGGRGSGGIDCSGLVQVALAATGIPAPRDTDMQRESLGEALPEKAALRRGDIINFPGHIGQMVDQSRLIHANAHWMSVVIEPLADVVARLAPNHDRPILSRRRIES